MAEKEEKEDKEKSKSGSWIKALLGMIGGLLSGAIMMYVTPLVDKVVKPPKPVANFEAQEDGLKVHFHILSTNGEGRWDFGDGSPLEEKLKPDQTLDHSYPRPGDYTVKLTWQNALGDEDDRSIPIHVEESTTNHGDRGERENHQVSKRRRLQRPELVCAGDVQSHRQGAKREATRIGLRR